MPRAPLLLPATPTLRLSLHFSLSHGIPLVDDRLVLSWTIYVIHHGLQWRDAPTAATLAAEGVGLIG